MFCKDFLQRRRTGNTFHIHYLQENRIDIRRFCLHKGSGQSGPLFQVLSCFVSTPGGRASRGRAVACPRGPELSYAIGIAVQPGRVQLTGGPGVQFVASQAGPPPRPPIPTSPVRSITRRPRPPTRPRRLVTSSRSTSGS